MKNFVVRAFVVALALTGAVSVAHSKTAGHKVVLAGSPTPTCPINDPKHCGMDDN